MASKVIKIRKGANVKLKGDAPLKLIAEASSSVYALKPTDFHGLTPKLSVKQGDKVKVGSTVFFDKKRPQIKFTSPVSGVVKEIVRGAKRKILEVLIENDGKMTCESFKVDTKDRASIIQALTSSGLWPFIRQRPFSTIANPEQTPKSIFISGFNSNPLAPDYNFILNGEKQAIQSAIDALSLLTDGKIYLGLPKNNAAEDLKGLSNVQVNTFDGPHPAGNVGIQIHHISPINKGDLIWYVDVQNLVNIGKFLSTGKYDASKKIALAGSSLSERGYFNVISGAQISSITQDRVNNDAARYISGNPFTGSQIAKDGYLGFYDDQITILNEVQDAEMFGWIIPSPKKKSFSRAFFSWLTPNKSYELNTSMNGEERAFVVSGQYEKLLPMDVLPVQLLKSILIEDVELMENLGIYEVAPEDFALCEFACTSKQDAQKIIRKGLDIVQKEFE